MNTPIQLTHDGIVITYDEQQNKWCFTLRGRDRSADSLAKAKEIIDKPVPKEKAKPFEKIAAWFFRYSDLPKKIEVTGIAENRSYGGQQVWINCEGNRSKESAAYTIYPQNEKNDSLIAQIVAKENEIIAARKTVDALKRKLSPLVLPKDE